MGELSDRLVALFRQAVEQTTDTPEKPTLWVTVGLDRGITSALNFPPLFGASGHGDPSLMAIAGARKAMLESLVSEPRIAGSRWCSCEEYRLLGGDIASIYYSPRVVGHGLFTTVFPLCHDLGGMEAQLAKYYEEPEDFPDDHELTAVLDVFENWYGCLYRVGDQYFVSYREPMSFDVELLDQETTIADHASDSTDRLVELTPDEASVAAFMASALSQWSRGERVSVVKSAELETLGFGIRLRRLAWLAREICEIRFGRKLGPTAARDATRQAALDILQRHWGYSEFRDFRVYDLQSGTGSGARATRLVSQGEIIDVIVDQALRAQAGAYSRDVFVTAPTGTGKSLMFQIPAIYLAEQQGLVSLVVSPLIGLMNDQVRSLSEMKVEMGATINSDISPVEKAAIADRVRSGSVSLLYLSPETLLSRSDVSMLIGERDIGLVVIDEAHIVTTWGKAFRSDYWYLGNYLQRLRKRRRFTVATFTATAIYGGPEDMYVETRDSLNLVDPITYFGYVKRDNIEIRIQSKLDYKARGKDYRGDKFKVLLTRLQSFLQGGKKVLVYFPLVGLIQEFRQYLATYADKAVMDATSMYYGPLDRLEKRAAYDAFRSGRGRIMLATKAFGMGIDIPDIDIVYHFAPTGNVCDFVQEIGRAGRSLQQAHACLDYFPADFTHVNRLHGISTLRPHQLVRTIEKILHIVERSGRKRNLLVSADEFRQIFASAGSDRSDDIDNRVKTALLVIEKDFAMKLGYSPLVARPRSLFTYECFRMVDGLDADDLGLYGRYFRKIDRRTDGGQPVYRADLKAMWEDHFRDLSFAQFKYQFHSPSSELAVPRRASLVPLVVLHADLTMAARAAVRRLDQLVELLSAAFAAFTNPNRHFSGEEFAEEMGRRGSLWGTRRGVLAEAILQCASEFCRLQRNRNNFYHPFISWMDDRGKYQLRTGGFPDFLSAVVGALRAVLASPGSGGETHEILVDRADSARVLEWYLMMGVLEDLGLLVYRSVGGENPEIFVRLNSFLPLERIVRDPSSYENQVLRNVQERHRLSVRMLTHLFSNCAETMQFWNAVEAYFLGEIPDAVLREPPAS